MQPGVSPFPKHFDGKRFFNPNGLQARRIFDLLRWKFTSRPEPSPRFVADVVPSQPPATVEGPGLRVTLINHSTVLLQKSGLHILTDPIWSGRASPLRSIGPRRQRAPGVKLEDLPRIDIVLLSHNHYDHLDLATLRWLAERAKPRFIVPTGVAAFLRSKNIGPAHEMDWGDALAVNGATIHSVSALHFSARGLFDRNRTLWCGFMIETQRHSIYFAGDTAFGDHFAQIRERFGPPHLALLPIGAYEPRWFMSAVHMSPEDAIRAHEILEPNTTIAIHHGTFQLGDEGIDTPRKRLHECDSPLIVLANGQSITLPI